MVLDVRNKTELFNHQILKRMETTPGIVESLIGKAEAFYITALELTKLKLTQPVAVAISVVAFKLLLIVLISILFKIFSTGAGLWLGVVTGKSNYGFFAVAALYLVLITVLHLFFQKWIKRLKSSDS